MFPLQFLQHQAHLNHARRCAALMYNITALMLLCRCSKHVCIRKSGGCFAITPLVVCGRFWCVLSESCRLHMLTWPQLMSVCAIYWVCFLVSKCLHKCARPPFCCSSISDREMCKQHTNTVMMIAPGAAWVSCNIWFITQCLSWTAWQDGCYSILGQCPIRELLVYKQHDALYNMYKETS